MGYIGNRHVANFQAIPDVQRFDGDGSTTVFTLNRTISNVQDILVSVDGVIQDTTSYTLPNGTSLTFDSAPTNGSANIFVNSSAKVPNSSASSSRSPKISCKYCLPLSAPLLVAYNIYPKDVKPTTGANIIPPGNKLTKAEAALEVTKEVPTAAASVVSS